MRVHERNDVNNADVKLNNGGGSTPAVDDRTLSTLLMKNAAKRSAVWLVAMVMSRLRASNDDNDRHNLIGYRVFLAGNK